MAAGEGTRMRSRKAKVLHELAGRPLVHYALDAAVPLKPERTLVIVGHQADAVAALVGDRAECVLQAEQLGTGHAVLQTKRALRGFAGDVVVLNGDVPLIRPSTVRQLVREHRKHSALATVLAVSLDDPTGYGRVISDAEGDVRIVEHVDASDDELLVDDINTGIYCFDSRFLFRALAGLRTDNAQGEYYLTDVLAAASKKSCAHAVVAEDETEGLGINSRVELAEAESILQERLVLEWMTKGVTFVDPATVYLSSETTIGRDTVVGPNVRLEGKTRIGEGCVLHGTSYLNNVTLGADVLIRWGVVATDSKVASKAQLGPYAHLRPEADLGEDVRVGNFVEVKKSKIGPRSKANHLAYIGDATVGRDTNIGAGTITCNYDGYAKHQTLIGDRVQIGSDTQLVAPLQLGSDCYVAAGSTVTTSVKAGSLVFNDKRQRVRGGWVASFRKRNVDAKSKGEKKTAGKRK